MNIYQHEPFLKEQIAARGYHLSIMGKAILLPLGIYGGAGVKSLEDVKMGAKVIIPNDPTNGARALLLLQRAGLIKLKTMEACDLIGPTLADIVENPKNLKIMEVEAPLLPRLLQEDASLAVINADWVIVAGMDPKTSMIHEDAINSPYTNVIVVKEGAETRKNTLEFVKLYQSDDVKKFIAQEFKGAVVAGW
jgi:D-methionine transport system substrate-binding protein